MFVMCFSVSLALGCMLVSLIGPLWPIPGWACLEGYPDQRALPLSFFWAGHRPETPSPQIGGVE